MNAGRFGGSKRGLSKLSGDAGLPAVARSRDRAAPPSPRLRRAAFACLQGWCATMSGLQGWPRAGRFKAGLQAPALHRRILYVASHDSALKAHRQNVSRREHNRQLRTRLRSALRDIRAAIDAEDPAKVKDALRSTISLVDKMAARSSSTATPPDATSHASPAASRRSQRRHKSTTSRSSRTRGSPPELLRSTSVRNSASTAAGTRRGSAVREPLPHEPSQLPQDHDGTAPAFHRERRSAARLRPCRRAGWRWSRPSRPARFPPLTTSCTSARSIFGFPAA